MDSRSQSLAHEWPDGGQLPQGPPAHVAGTILNVLRKNKTETIVGLEARGTVLADKFLPRIVDVVLKQVVKRVYKDDPK